MSDLTKQHCVPCEGGAEPINKETATTLLSQTKGWALDDDALEISKTFKFKNFHETMAFVNALAWIAHTEDHHPELEIGYSRCHVHYSTHAIGGLSTNDFICAAKVNKLIGN